MRETHFSSCSLRSETNSDDGFKASFKKNKKYHKKFSAREMNNKINKANEQIYIRLQEIHKRKTKYADQSPRGSQKSLNLSTQGSPPPTSRLGNPSLNYEKKMVEARRIDKDNLVLAKRILSQKTQLPTEKEGKIRI